MEAIRVLQVVTIMNRGGLETMLLNYYRQIDRSKIQFDFMVHREEKGHYDDEILSLGGNIYPMPQIRPGNYHLYFKKLDEFFSQHTEYRVAHSHLNENSSFVLRAAKNAGVPCRVAHSHISNLGLDLKLPFRIYARLSMKDNPNRYFACSKSSGQWLFGKEVSASKELTVLNNAVNVDSFKYNNEIRRQVRDEWKADKKLVLGHVGRFNKQKNHEFLIDIFKAVHAQLPDSMLVLAGDGYLRHVIENKVIKLGLSSHVKFLGVREDIQNLMQGIDLFLFPSLFEGLPVVLVEAQAAGLNCVVSDTITRETDMTGRLQFISLKKSPNEWADTILASSYKHEDTSVLMRQRGYDTCSTAEWLTGYYSTAHGLQTRQASSSGGLAMSSTLTVFTTTYNRAYTLHLCYESLKRQTSKDFVWLIVDDGSTDHTEELIQSWIIEGLVPIQYHYQQNQGMHGAHNTAYDLMNTELNVCIDSDDYMSDDAVEKIVCFWKKHGCNKVSGIVALDSYANGQIIGSRLPENLKASGLFDLYNKQGVTGDKKLVYRTELTRRYPYPIFNNEKYVGLAYKYYKLDQQYPMLLMNEIICHVEYRTDGSSLNMLSQYRKNPKGFAFFRKELMKLPFASFSFKYKQAIHYVSSSLISKNRRFFWETPCKIVTLLAIPLGIVLYCHILRKTRIL